MSRHDPQRPTRAEIAPLVRAYYAKPGNGGGGSLHIVLEDHNVKDHDVRWCIEYARKNGDEDGVRLGEMLLRLSPTQRRKLKW